MNALLSYVRFEASINRSLRQHQDEAFMESLRADQEKERRRQEQRLAVEAEERRLREVNKRNHTPFMKLNLCFSSQELIAEEERRQAIAREKIECVSKVPSEPDVNHPDAIHIVIKLPCGERLDRRFLKSHSLEVLPRLCSIVMIVAFLAGDILLRVLPPEFPGVV